MADNNQIKKSIMAMPTKTSQSPIGKFASKLFFSRIQAHVFHLSVKGEGGFAKHKALEEYYEAVLQHVDVLIEAHQGTNPIVTDYSMNEKLVTDTNEITPYFEHLLVFVKEARTEVSSDSDQQNIIDNIATLIRVTLYKLNKLK
jgi:DNA-binding ferritin-like protein